MNSNASVWKTEQEINQTVMELRELIMHQYFQKALEKIEELPVKIEPSRYEKLTEHIADLEKICRNNLRLLAENELTKNMAVEGKLEESFEKSDKLLLQAYAVPTLYFITPSTLEEIHRTKAWIKGKIEKERFAKSFWY